MENLHEQRRQQALRLLATSPKLQELLKNQAFERMMRDAFQIQKAKKSRENSNQSTQNHFSDINKMVEDSQEGR